MPNFELTYIVISLQKRRFWVEAPDSTTAKQRVLDGCLPGGVISEVLFFDTPCRCKEVVAAVVPAGLKAATDQDGCPIWVPV